MALVSKRTYLLGFKVEASFGTEATMAAPDLIEVLDDRDLKGGIDQVENTVLRNSLSTLAKINSINRAGGSFSVQGLGGGAADPTPQYDAVMQAAIGQSGVLIVADKTVATDASISGLTLSSATDVEVGVALGWLNSNSELEVVWVTAIAGADVDTAPYFSAVPANSDAIYKSRTYKMSASGYDNSYTVKEYFGTSHDMTYTGMKCATLDGTFNTGEIITLATSWAGKDFAEGTDDSPAYTEPTNAPIVGLYGRCYLDNTSYDISNLSFTINNGMVEKLSLNSSGIDDMVATSRACNGNFDVYYDTNAFLTDFKNATKRALYVQAGKTVGNTVAVRFPQVKYTDVSVSNDDLRKNPCAFDAEKTSSEELFMIAFL